MTWSTFETYCATKGVANKARLILREGRSIDVLVEIILLSLRSAGGRAASGRMRIAHVFWRNSAAKEVVTATGSSGGCTMREAGSRTSRPIMTMLG